MKIFRLLICAVAMILVLCGTVYSQPKPGVLDYDSRKDDFQAGVWAEFLTGGGEGKPGNIIRAESWDSTDEQYYYKFRGAVLDNVVLLATPKNDKDEVIRNYYEYRTIYKNGELTIFNYSKAAWHNPKNPDNFPYVVKLQNTIVITKKYIDANGSPTGEMEFALIVADAQFRDFPGFTVSVTAKFEKGKPIPIDDSTLPYPTPYDEAEPKFPGYWGPISWAIISIDAPEVVHAPFDIKPGSCPNPVNTKSNGVLPAAILGTADFDVTAIDTTTIRLGVLNPSQVNPLATEPPGISPLRWNYEDVGAPFLPLFDKKDAYACNQSFPDRRLDLSLKFDAQALVDLVGIHPAQTSIRVWIWGKMLDERPFLGEDIILIVPGSYKPTSSTISNKVLDLTRGLSTRKIAQ
jgi:hypothetical protein